MLKTLGLPAWLCQWVWSQRGSPPCPLLCRSTARGALPQLSSLGTLLPVTRGFQIRLPVPVFFKTDFLFFLLKRRRMPHALHMHSSVSSLACRAWWVGVCSCHWSHGFLISKPELSDRRSRRSWLGHSVTWGRVKVEAWSICRLSPACTPVLTSTVKQTIPLLDTVQVTSFYSRCKGLSLRVSRSLIIRLIA